MAAGPSKEELEMYWENSRPYFDELAKHYEKADPAYYKEFIHPFYSNPFRSKGGSGFSEGIYAKDTAKKRSSPAIVVLAAVLVAVIGLGASMFIFMQGNSSNNDEPTRLKEKVTADTIITKDITEEPPAVKEKVPKRNMNYLRGEKMFEEKYYEQAEKYLKRVPETDKDYKDAQRLIEIIQTMDKQKETDNSRKKRVQPVQPVR